MKSTGLYRSARKGNYSKLTEYLGSQAHVMEMLSKEHRTMLHFSAEDQFLDICKLFLDHAKEFKIKVDKVRFVDEDSETALDIAIRTEHFELVKLILSYDPIIISAALHAAARTNNVAITAAVLARLSPVALIWY